MIWNNELTASNKPSNDPDVNTPNNAPSELTQGTSNGWHRTFESLTYRNYQFLWTGNLLINTADWLQILTVGWLMLRMTGGNALLTGTVVGIRSLPILLLGPWAGVLADRVNRRYLIAFTQIGLAASAIVFAILVASTDFSAGYSSDNTLKTWHLFAYVIITGILHTLMRPVRQALIPNVVPRSVLRNAMALNATTRTGTRLLGPALGGVLIEVLGGFSWNFYIEAGSYCLVIVMMLLMRTPYQTESTAREESIWNNMKEGIIYIWNNRVILHLIVMTVIPNFVFQPLVFIMPIFVTDALGGSEGMGGLLLSVMGVGGVVSTIVIAALGFQLGTGRTVILSLVVGTTSILLMAQIPWIPFTIAMFLIMGFAQTQFRVGNSTLVQSLVPDELRGRVTSVYQFDNGFTPVAVLITSSMVQWTDVITTMTIISSISLCFSITLLLFAKLVKQLE